MDPNATNPIPPLPLKGARMVPAGVASAEMAALGFRASDEHRAFFGNAVLVFRNGRWTLESGYLNGKDSAAFQRYVRKAVRS